jgi:hypothetical protein
MESIRRLIEEQNVVALNHLVGCTDQEIEELMADQEVARLPLSYKWFLRTMGRDAGPILRGSQAFFPQLLGMKSAGIELLSENNAKETLGPDSFVIGLHQGYQLFWLSSVADSEPAVLMFQEGERVHSRKWNNFEAYLTDVVSGLGRK